MKTLSLLIAIFGVAFSTPIAFAKTDFFNKFYNLALQEGLPPSELIEKYRSLIRQCDVPQMIPILYYGLAYQYELAGQYQNAHDAYKKTHSDFASPSLNMLAESAVDRTNKLVHPDVYVAPYAGRSATNSSAASFDSRIQRLKKELAEGKSNEIHKLQYYTAVLNMGQIHYSNRDFLSAVTSFEAATSSGELRSPDGILLRLQATFLLANSYLLSNQLNHAKKTFNAIAIDPAATAEKIQYHGESVHAKYLSLYKQALIDRSKSYLEISQTHSLYFNILSLIQDSSDESLELSKAALQTLAAKFPHSNFGVLARFQLAIHNLFRQTPAQLTVGVKGLEELKGAHPDVRTEQGRSLTLLAKSILAESYFTQGNLQKARAYAREVIASKEFADYKDLPDEVQVRVPPLGRLQFIYQQSKE
jgi:tetratricopeptide (TPR) repeat protein